MLSVQIEQDLQNTVRVLAFQQKHLVYRLAYNGDLVETRNADCGLTIKLAYRFHGRGVKGQRSRALDLFHSAIRIPHSAFPRYEGLD